MQKIHPKKLNYLCFNLSLRNGETVNVECKLDLPEGKGRFHFNTYSESERGFESSKNLARLVKQRLKVRRGKSRSYSIAPKGHKGYTASFFRERGEHLGASIASVPKEEIVGMIKDLFSKYGEVSSFEFIESQ